MHAAALRVELRIPDAHSLKEKRGKLKPAISELRKQFGISVAEVDVDVFGDINVDGSGQPWESLSSLRRRVNSRGSCIRSRSTSRNWTASRT